jgi:signal transduction histidine kinase
VQGISARVPKGELSRALSNLINNSVEAIDQGQGIVWISLACNGSENVIQIRDNGKGIPTKHLLDLGSPGFSFGKGDLDQSGNGLGLFHAKTTIENLGGRIKIESTEGLGTTISLILPLEPGTHAQP